MTFGEFERRAGEIFDDIPPEYREGVDGLTVVRDALPHSSLPDVYTLGECRSEFYPSEYGGPGEVHSVVVLFYGSFAALARLKHGEEWDWEGELWETITHEVRHHLESLAAEDALEVQDYAEDQNFARREGEPFDPFFYRSGTRVGDDVYEVDGDLFIEREVDAPSSARAQSIPVSWDGNELLVPRPGRVGDVHFLTLRGLERGEGGRERGDLVVVLLPRRGVWKSVRGLFRTSPPEVLQSEVEVEE